MFYFMCTENGYVKSYGTAEKTVHIEITEAEYNTIVSAVNSKPIAQDGYAYVLRADTFEWELVELPPMPETEPTTDDIINTLFGGGAE